jgi:hypothetical protein
MKKIIREGDRLPWGYGVAYRNWDSMTAVCYPFPLNHLIGFILPLWWKCRNAKRNEFDEIINKKTDAAFQRGLVSGLRQAEHQSVQELHENISNILKEYPKI